MDNMDNTKQANLERDDIVAVISVEGPPPPDTPEIILTARMVPALRHMEAVDRRFGQGIPGYALYEALGREFLEMAAQMYEAHFHQEFVKMAAQMAAQMAKADGVVDELKAAPAAE